MVLVLIWIKIKQFITLTCSFSMNGTLTSQFNRATFYFARKVTFFDLYCFIDMGMVGSIPYDIFNCFFFFKNIKNINMKFNYCGKLYSLPVRLMMTSGVTFSFCNMKFYHVLTIDKEVFVNSSLIHK